MDQLPGHLKVLLIEHDEAFARTVSGMLEQSHETIERVTVASTLEQALTFLAHSRPHVVILEFFLPDGAGLTNILLLRERAPRIPVIIFGAADDEAFALEAVHAGAQDYLVKGHLSTRGLLRSIRYTVERHSAEMAVVAAEERYRGLFDHLVEGIFQTSPAGHYLLANTTLARIYGYATADELVNSVTDIARRLYVQPGRREEFKRHMDASDTLTNFESEIYRKDGTTIWISENCRAVRDGQGKLLFYEGTVEDITQRRQAEEKLRHSEALYHSLVETMPQCIFRKDIRGRYTFANPEFCRVLRRRLDQILHHTIFDFLPEDLANARDQDDLRVIRDGKPLEQIEESMFGSDGPRFIQVIKLPIFDAHGKVIGLQGMFWDITAMKVAEERIKQANTELARSQEELRLKDLLVQDDLKMAREIQFTMLPQQYPVLPKGAKPAESAFQFTHRYLPTGTVGGDFFSVSALSDTEVAVFICDVAGHGVRSALITAMIRAIVEELRNVAQSPGQFMSRLNSDLFAILRHSGAPVLTTAFYLVADCAKGTMRYANAGHPMPLHIRRSTQQVAPLPRAPGKMHPALGLFEQAEYYTSETVLEPDDLIMLFTDGLFEVYAPDQEIYTQQMLTEATRARWKLPAAQLFDEVVAEIRAYSATGGFDDDVCLVGMEFTGATPAKKQ